jgi:uncharacterized protein (DUF1330 family)
MGGEPNSGQAGAGYSFQPSGYARSECAYVNDARRPRAQHAESLIHSGAETMSAYILASLHITDPGVFEEYRSRVPAVIAAHGGRYLVRGGSVDVLEGDALGNRLVIVEFPDMSRLKAFYQSPEYQPLLEIRNRSAISTLLAIEGV